MSHSSRRSTPLALLLIAVVVGLIAACSSPDQRSAEGGKKTQNTMDTPGLGDETSQTVAEMPPLGPFGIEDTSLGGEPDESRPVRTPNPRSWMYDTYWGTSTFATANGHDSGIRSFQIELGQIAIPGSHDSTTYKVGDFADVCGDPGLFAKNFGKGMAERWARTQHYDLYTQATLGIRSFDLRIYYDGSSIRTCHTLDAASLDEAIRGDGGLNRFVKEQPLEPVILNLSHYKAPEGKSSEGLDNLVNYLRDNVCDKAMPATRTPRGSATEIAVNPARLQLVQIAEAAKNYIVLVDRESGVYDYLADHGLKSCVFPTGDFVSGGYAGIQDVDLGNGVVASTNLWTALARSINGTDRLLAVRAREATQLVLIDAMKNRTRDKLHETSYIWAYDKTSDDGFGDADAVWIKQRYDDDLLQMTEKGVVEWNSYYIFSGEVEVGLLEQGADFIGRLDERAQALKTNVNIVNMDAIGNTWLTRDGFIRPVLALNTRMVW